MESIIFFDGVCNLCHGAVQFVIERDKKNLYKFASLQSDFAQHYLGSFKINPTALNSFILAENGKIYQRSTAALRVARKLSGLWPLLYVLIIIPPFIRDFLYNYVAKNRYRWFGKEDKCWVPTAALKSRFYS